MRALVIDDSKAVRTLLGRLLSELGFEVWEASDGLEALSLLDQVGDADVALVDWNMPGMDGYEFVNTIRSDSSHDGLTLIMVTTESEREKVVNALNAGADGYLIKPFSKQSLMEKLGALGVETL